MAQDRENVEEAWPGDIIGLHNHGTIKIGDTFTKRKNWNSPVSQTLPLSIFRRIILKNPLKMKQLQKGLQQLAEEGAIQVFRPKIGASYIMGAVGVLQFEVTVARLKNEYSVEAIYEPIDFQAARWVECKRQENAVRIRTEKPGRSGHRCGRIPHLSGTKRVDAEFLYGKMAWCGVPQDPGKYLTARFEVCGVRFSVKRLEAGPCLFRKTSDPNTEKPCC